MVEKEKSGDIPVDVLPLTITGAIEVLKDDDQKLQEAVERVRSITNEILAALPKTSPALEDLTSEITEEKETKE